MKFTTSLTIALLPAVMALPTFDNIKKTFARQSLNAITDSYLFSISLPAFITNRNARNPPTLDWTSDACTSSPDNPFGFNFVPACNRHDFGYHNYRRQSRFTQSAKLRIDDNFRADLRYQCTFESAESVCRGLANVYYTFVRAFGGDDATPGKREVDLVAEYEKAVEEYDALVAKEQAAGRLPTIE
jgi:hypothetical protein